jgi:class I lanthipeptide synthase
MSASSDGPGDFTDSGFFVMRTPLLPFDALVAWSQGLEPLDTTQPADELARHRRALRSRLREILERPEVREAIFVASPSLDGHIDEWVADPESPHGRDYERALVRYVSRMAGRATPFGLFAGVSTGRIGDETQLRLERGDHNGRHTRVDAEYLLQVVAGLLADPTRRQRTAYRPNSSLYRAGGRRRYVRSRPGAKEQRHLLVSVRDSEGMQAALDGATSGATPVEIAAGVAATGTDSGRAERIVAELIDQQVLVPDLDVQLTGADPVYGLADAAPPLAAARAALEALDREPLGVPTARYRAVAASLEALPAPLTLDRLFQVDMTKASPHATLGRDVVAEILRGADLLRRLAATQEDKTLERFIDRFRDRYEERAVPLLEALDPDLGVSFDGDAPSPSPLLEGLNVRDDAKKATWTPRDDHLLSRLAGLAGDGAGEMVLDGRDIERLERKDVPPLPDAFAVLAVVAAASDVDLAAGRFRVLVSPPDGPSGARLLGRFCHEDPALRAAVEGHLRAEEALDPDAVYAEIVHLPRARDVNVLARPVLRDYEIECHGRSGAASERRLQLDDLLLSVDGNELALRSRRLGRRVVPRLTSAHNYPTRGVAVYRFLCRLQDWRGPREGFWGPLGSAPFLPRVRAGRVILSRARWRLGPQDLAPSGGRDADVAAVQAWRRRRGVPRHVLLVEQALELPVDLDNILAVDGLVQAIRARRGGQIEEHFPGPDELRATGPDGAYVHEVVVPFVRSHPRPRRRGSSLADRPVRRTFPPGSDWVYARVYTGETMADRILTDEIAPLVGGLIASGSIDSWFFLRYRDPEFHLRIRLRGSARSEVEALGAALIDRGRAWRIELGTYEREVERYGGTEAIELIERIFHADSEAVLAILPLLEPGDEGQEERWRLGLAGADRLLADLGLDSSERFALASGVREARERELRWGHAERVKIGQRFRLERRALGRLLAPTHVDPNPLAPGLEILDARSRLIGPIGEELRQLERAGRLTAPVTDIAGSLLHMHLNRILRGDNVAQEAVICDFLTRLYEAEAKRVSS